MSKDFSTDIDPERTQPTEKQKGSKRDWEDEVCDLMKKEWDKGQTYCSTLNKSFDDIYDRLRGERPKKDYDWESNVVINKVFQVCWTAIPYFIGKIWGSKPMIGVKGFDPKGCWQREVLLETWRAKDKYLLTMVLGLLRGMLNGVAYFKKGWKQDLPNDDRPDDIVINNKDIVVDWLLSPGQSCREGRFVIHREVVDLNTLYDSKINYINLDELSAKPLQSTQSNTDHQSATGKDGQADPPKSDFYDENEIFERQGTLPVRVKKNGEIRPEFDPDKRHDEGVQSMEMIVSMVDYDNPTLVRWEPNIYGEKQFIDMHLYLDPERWNSMGLIEPMTGLFDALNDNINAMFDEIWMNLQPPVIIDEFAVEDWDSIRYAPGQKWLTQGNPGDHFLFHRPSNITSDAWQKHMLLKDEIELTTSTTAPVQGQDKSKTATQGVMNAQFSLGKLDFLVTMIEQTLLVPDADMTLRFAQKFAHPLTFLSILGEPFKFDEMLGEYKYIPCASAVNSEQQRELEVQQDLQLLQTFAPLLQINPGISKVINELLANIAMNRNKPKMAAMLDENWFEPQTEGGQMARMTNQIGAGAPSNEQGIPMSMTERSLRQARPNQQMLQ